MTGVIVDVNSDYQRGTIRADDGTLHPFQREGMVRWLEFRELKVGDRVAFELDANDAINVERLERQR